MMVNRRLGALLLSVLLSSTGAAQATLTGFVREDATLKPMKDVEIIIEAISKRARSDDKGKFTLRDISPGTHVVQVRRVGFEPLSVTMEFAAGTKEHVFFLNPAVTQLDTVTATAARPRGMGREAFEERRKSGFGKFLDAVELKKNEHRKAFDLLRELGVRIVPPVLCTAREETSRPPTGGGWVYVERNPPYCDTNRSKRVAVSAMVSYNCPMMVVLDGVIVYRPAQGGGGAAAQTGGVDQIEWERTFDLNAINVSALEGVEIYRRSAEIPIEFGGSSAGCGVLVLWQRR